VGVRADPGRAPQAGGPGRSKHRPARTASGRPGTGTASHRSDLDRVSASTGQGGPGLRLICRGTPGQVGSPLRCVPAPSWARITTDRSQGQGGAPHETNDLAAGEDRRILGREEAVVELRRRHHLLCHGEGPVRAGAQTYLGARGRPRRHDGGSGDPREGVRPLGLLRPSTMWLWRQSQCGSRPRGINGEDGQGAHGIHPFRPVGVRNCDHALDQTFYVVKPPAPPSSRRRRGDGRPRSKGAASGSAWPPCGTCPPPAADPCRPEPPA